MSYILEALKKAEAERHGGAPQAVRMPVFASAPAGQASSRKRLLWAMIPAIVLAVAGTAWFIQEQEEAPSRKLAQAPVQASPALALPPPPEVTSAPAVEPARPTPKPREKPAEKATEKAPEQKTPEKKAAEKSESKKSPPAEQQVMTLRELPEHIQREIPPLSVGGYIYSGSKADRSVLINKRLLREGDEVAPGLMLETMQPNGMIFSYKGYRYRTGY